MNNYKIGQEKPNLGKILNITVTTGILIFLLWGIYQGTKKPKKRSKK